MIVLLCLIELLLLILDFFCIVTTSPFISHSFLIYMNVRDIKYTASIAKYNNTCNNACLQKNHYIHNVQMFQFIRS